MKTRFLFVLVTAFTMVGCISKPTDLTLEERKDLALEPYRELDAQKNSLWREGFNRRRFEFPQVGTLEVLHWQLSGWPGNEWVEARIRYVNTTEIPMSEAFVQLDVVDSSDAVRGSSAVRWINPAGFAFFPGHSYIGYLKTPTNGAHQDPAGWGWAVDADAIVEETPGPPPVLINHDLENGRRDRALQAALRSTPIRQSREIRNYTPSGISSYGARPIRYSSGRSPAHTPGVTR